MELQWEDDDPIEMYAEKLNLPQFAIMYYRPQHCEEKYKAGLLQLHHRRPDFRVCKLQHFDITRSIY